MSHEPVETPNYKDRLFDVTEQNYRKVFLPDGWVFMAAGTTSGHCETYREAVFLPHSDTNFLPIHPKDYRTKTFADLKGSINDQIEQYEYTLKTLRDLKRAIGSIEGEVAIEQPTPSREDDCRSPFVGCWHVINENHNSTSFGPDHCRKPNLPGTLYCKEHQHE